MAGEKTMTETIVQSQKISSITTVIVTNDQGMPARLFLIVHFLSMHLIDCCVFPLPPIVVANTAVHRSFMPLLPNHIANTNIHRYHAAAVH
jgi:hypothetical protein